METAPLVEVRPGDWIEWSVEGVVVTSGTRGPVFGASTTTTALPGLTSGLVFDLTGGQVRGGGGIHAGDAPAPAAAASTTAKNPFDGNSVLGGGASPVTGGLGLGIGLGPPCSAQCQE